jgi:predicted RNA-binding protein with RPS1 domain
MLAVAVQVGSVIQASVASVKPYGIFVRLKGFRANGLVHLSQVHSIELHDVLL